MAPVNEIACECLFFDIDFIQSHYRIQHLWGLKMKKHEKPAVEKEGLISQVAANSDPKWGYSGHVKDG